MKPGCLKKLMGLRVEEELILLCAGVRTGPAGGNRIEEIVSGGLDADYLLRVARRHAVTPSIYACLREVDKRDGLVVKLKEAFESNARRNLFLAGELVRVLKSLERRGIDAVTLRGPSLAAHVYGNLALRQFDDIDILIRRCDFAETSRALEGLGYKPGGGVAAGASLTFTGVERAAIVEVHGQAAPRGFSFVPSFDELRGAAGEVRIGGASVPALVGVELLLHLCMHGASHGWERLGWIRDVAELLARRETDWPGVMKTARSLGCVRMLLVGVGLAAMLLGAPVPDFVEKKIRRNLKAKALTGAAIKRLFRQESSWLQKLAMARFYLATMERARDRMRYVFEPGEWDGSLAALPAGVPYVLRPARLAAKYAPLALKRLLAPRA